eukprot:gnl/MRDRNA2_/MRDRNA2_75517_c0_seq3.p1 gnl/MRDRNA2_/MRDRNA2_75517_c0~~gnl/MRDRNA2_/MRDRNA2_75517_c0_seq3.p1  ORF type:complete len:350 (-),score=64.07 gnl/MRDRNA2_/MRDRNA2_75517_c0_seq3:213-1262(-)
MHGVPLAILSTFVMQQLMAQQMMQKYYNVMDRSVNSLAEKASLPQAANLDDTTLRKPSHVAVPRDTGLAVSRGRHSKLLTSERWTSSRAVNFRQEAALDGSGSTSWMNLARTALIANTHGSHMRDISRKSATNSDLSEKLKDEMLKMDAETQGKLSKASSEVVSKARQMAGITPPLGFFDPLGLSCNISEGRLLFYREVELKHGRVAMLASLGILVGEQFHPLWGGNIDVPSYIAFQETPLQTFWPAVVLAIGIPEVFSVFTFDEPYSRLVVPFAEINIPRRPRAWDYWWSMRTDRVPGDMKFDPLGLKPTDPEELKEMQNKELNNGRLAMIAAAGMIAQELATGQKLF